MPNDFKLCPVCGNPPSGSPQAPQPPPPPQVNPQQPLPPPNYNPYPPQQPNPQRYVGHKSEGVTLVLAILLGLIGLCGIGHMYVDKVGKGFGILFGALALEIIGGVMIGIGMFSPGLLVIGVFFIIGWLIIFIWQIVSSYNLCKEYNNYLANNNGRPPW